MNKINQKTIAVVCGFFLAGLIGAPASALAASRADAASAVAKELAAGLKKAGLASEMAATAPLQGSAGPGDIREFETALLNALASEQGLKIVDKQALKRSIDEAAVTGADIGAALGEIAGGLGAKVLITGSVDLMGGALTANIKVVEIAKGTMIVAAKATFPESDGGDISTEAQSLEVELRRLADNIYAGLDKMEGDVRYQKFAVLPFEEVGETTADKQLGLLVAAELTTRLAKSGLLMVERGQLSKVIEEMALSQSGLVDPSQSAEVGKLAGAQGLVVGTVSEVGDHYKVAAKVITTKDANIVLARDARLPAADLVALSSEAVVLRTVGGAVYRSLLLPGWGQLYNREPVKGALFVTAEVATAGLGLTYHLLGDAKKKKYQNLPAGSDEKFTNIKNKAESYYRLRNTFLWATAGLHVLNILDAYLSGKSYSTASVSAGPGGVSVTYSW